MNSTIKSDFFIGTLIACSLELFEFVDSAAPSAYISVCYHIHGSHKPFSITKLNEACPFFSAGAIRSTLATNVSNTRAYALMIPVIFSEFYKEMS